MVTRLKCSNTNYNYTLLVEALRESYVATACMPSHAWYKEQYSKESELAKSNVYVILILAKQRILAMDEPIRAPSNWVHLG